MTTIYTSDIEEAASFIRRGQLCAFPTETVYGLGADATNPEAIDRIFEAKRRPADNPLIVHLADADAIGEVAREIPTAAADLAAAFMPGPLTLVLPRRPSLPSGVTAELDTVGVRVPDLEVTRRFLAACAVPVAAPSANLSGRPSPTTWEAVREDLDGRIAAVLTGPPAERGLESTVVDCTTPQPTLLRAGAIPTERLAYVVPDLVVGAPEDAAAPRSPGMKHRHYAPHLPVHLVDSVAEVADPERSAFIGLALPKSCIWMPRVRLCSSVEEYAHDLYDFMRQCERDGVERLYCERVPDEGLGRALMDRLRRAAQG